MAISLDGNIASTLNEIDLDRKKYGFLDDADRQHVLKQLADSDAVITGAESLRASGGAFEIKNHKGVNPIWIVFTNRGLPPEMRFWNQQAIDRFLVSKKPLSEIPEHKGCVENWNYENNNPVEFVLNKLKAKKCEKVLLFGGSKINEMFYNADLVNELIITICPVIFGTKNPIPLVANGLDAPVRLSLQTSHLSENLVFLKYTVNPTIESEPI